MRKGCRLRPRITLFFNNQGDDEFHSVLQNVNLYREEQRQGKVTFLD